MNDRENFSKNEKSHSRSKTFLKFREILNFMIYHILTFCAQFRSLRNANQMFICDPGRSGTHLGCSGIEHESLSFFGVNYGSGFRERYMLSTYFPEKSIFS